MLESQMIADNQLREFWREMVIIVIIIKWDICAWKPKSWSWQGGRREGQV